MDPVVTEPGSEGLGEMLADLIRGNLEKHPGRRALIEGDAGTVNLTVVDADVEVGLRFTGRDLRIGSKVRRADLSIATDAQTLMSLTNVPLRFGMPDTLTPAGRTVAAKMLNGELKVRGLPRHLKLMVRLQRLFTVA